MMRSFIVILISCYVAYSKAIECGINKANSDDIRRAVSTCVKNNDTMNKIWEMTMSSSQTESSSGEKESDSAEENDEKSPPASNTKNMRGGKTTRIKRAKPAKSFTNQQSSTTTMRSTKNYNNMMKESDEDENSNDSGNSSEEKSNSNKQDTSDKCIIHCVLEQMSLTDDNGLPDHSKILTELLKNSPKREIKNFFQDSTDECFQEVDEENVSDPCEYSNKLIFCLADKGKSNCADWPAGTLPF